MAQKPPPAAVWTAFQGSSTSVATWMLGGGTHYAISLDGGRTMAITRVADYQMRLRYGTFDPISGVPEVAPLLRSRSGSRLFLVQYITQGLPEYRSQLERVGAEVLQFFPSYGNLVRMDPSVKAVVEGFAFVRWVGDYHPAYRIDEVMHAELISGVMPLRRYFIHVTKKGAEEKTAVAAHIRGLGGRPDDFISPHGYLLTGLMTSPQLLEIANRDDILFIDRWSPPEADMDKARILFGADYIEGVAGFTGAGVRAEVMDGGLRTTHTDFISNVPIINNGNTSNQSHGTSTFGQIFGDGASLMSARGVLPDAQGIFSSYNLLGSRYAHTANLVQSPLNCVFQSNSWGNSRTFFYTNVSADMDNLLFDHDIVICQSQSNAGNQDSRPQAWAKNIVSVGGVRHFDTLSTADDSWSGGASIGPAQDGRIKPDLSAFYDGILTTSSSNNTAHTSSFGGTSGATPITAGHFGLFFEMWAGGLFGNPVLGTTVFAARPHMTTAKAMLINFASQYPFVGAGHDLTRVHQGWGRADLQKAYDGRNRVLVIDETDILTSLQSTVYTVTVTTADPEFRATLIFADPPGNPAAAQARINDLTLKVTDPSGLVYFGNNGLLSNNYSTAGGMPNTVDTVENVFVNNPTPGTWTVEVIATEINQDGHTESPGLDADYALVVAGVTPPPPPTQDVGQPNSTDASLRIAGALNINNFVAVNGTNGPFFVTLSAGQQLRLDFGSQPNWDFILMTGPLNRNNALLGGIGSLDIGLLGSVGNFSDIVFLINGVSGNTFFDSLGQVGQNGTQLISLPITNAIPSGVLGTFQAVMVDPVGTTLKLTAATEVTIQ